MKKVFVFVGLILFIAAAVMIGVGASHFVTASAQVVPTVAPAIMGASPSNMHVVLGRRTLLKAEQLTDLSGPRFLNPPEGADEVEIQAEDQNLRISGAGTAVTGAVGMLIIVNQSRVYEGDLSTLQIMEDTATAKANLFWWDTN